MTPKEVLKLWVEIFNKADAEALSQFYTDDAVNHQVVTDPVIGKTAIHQRFVEEFSTARMV